MPDVPRWSLADTHLTIRPHGTYADRVWVVLDGSEWVAEFRARGEAEEYVKLRATVEAQAAVIERYRQGWYELNGNWTGQIGAPEPMTPAEQTVLYGEVVSGG